MEATVERIATAGGKVAGVVDEPGRDLAPIALVGGDHFLATRVIEAGVVEVVRVERLVDDEGRLRDQDYYKGRWWDELCFGLLEPEWRGPRDWRTSRSR